MQLKCICKLTCLQRLLKRALLTCLQSGALIKIKAADLKPTDKLERSEQQEESTLGSKKGVQLALPDGTALHGACPKGWINKFPAYTKLKCL